MQDQTFHPFCSPYIQLLKKSLIGFQNIGNHEFHPLNIVRPNFKTAFLYPLDKILRKRNFAICKLVPVDRHERLNGYDWPANAATMIGMNRLNNIEECICDILNNKVEGDFIEAGVWRGGAVILMKALLKDFGIIDRKVWAADSFQGLPNPDIKKYPRDTDSKLHKYKILKASLDEVKVNFQNYDLLDDQVIFLHGWFKNTLPDAPIKKLALLRIDADMYESTTQALTCLYPKLSQGGYVIIDDYNAFPFCKAAVDDYRKQFNITEKISEIDQEAIYWRKS